MKARITDKLLIILVIGFLTVDSIAKEYSPVVIFYPRSEYKSKSQNWNVSTDNYGNVFFGNNDGLLEYDGFNWTVHKHPDAVNTRSLYYDESSERIYAGYYEEVGYWQRNKHGELYYTSLVSKFDKKLLKDNSIWSITKKDSTLYLQSFSSILSYNLTNEKSSVVASAGSFLFLGQTNGNIYSRSSEQGLITLERNGYKTVMQKDSISSSTIRFYLYHPEGTIFGSGEHGLLLLTGDNVSEWNSTSNRILNHQNVNCGVRLSNGNYAIGTISNGLYILDPDGEILHHINQHNGLENNTVLSLTHDNQDNLWLGLDNGIAHIIINSQLHYRVDKNTIPYSIYSVIEHQGYCYLATNSGIMYAKAQSAKQLNFKDLKQLSGINEHIWKLDIVEGELLCGGNSGLYVIHNNEVMQLSSRSGVTDFTITRGKEKKQLIASTYSELIVFEKEKERWKYSHFIDGFNGTCRLIEIDYFGYVWLSHEVKGLTRLQLDEKNKKIIHSKSFGKSDGLPNDYHLDIFKAGQHIVISTDNGLFTYDNISNRIVSFEKLNHALSLTGRASSIVTENDQYFWVVTGHKIAQVNNSADSLFVEQYYTVGEHFSLTDKFQSLSTGGSNTYFCLDNGFASINKDYHENITEEKAFFTRIEIQQPSNLKPILLPLDPSSKIKLKKGKSTITFTFNTNFINTHKPIFQYKLSPIQDEWINLTDDNKLTLQNLDAGSYTLLLRFKNEKGGFSKEIKYDFTVLPLMLSYIYIPISLFFIISLIILISIISYKKRTTKIKVKHDKQLKNKEKLVSELKEEMKRKELENLENQLTLSTNEILKRDEAIGTIKQELTKTYTELKGRFPQKNYKRILETIDMQIANNEKDRANFEQHFMASQTRFYENLKKGFPNLTVSDLRLCSLLKMNLSSKEIASYLNITHRSVEVSRYRLRKKLNLSSDDNLVDLLIKY
ncbi:triple tyrosine motif-containing protein [Carboxylicivirga sp. M1479]|uniref:helix-turn-helix and ligand-binding sensor domain-containing protein n=1 Tax=Carboxylicivirga sp. M1479 TaxID=2594476 RepID=UPI001177BF69|nr:triple tyrosine motif-containing protein [Carboxylicivirga sp. M1479]TRX72565.1 hypothetical protein FNN09_01095 [Carboxylicivirga sp. M1479]